MKVVWSCFVCAMRLGSVVMAMAIAVLMIGYTHDARERKVAI